MNVEIFRCWHDRTWDTDIIEIPDLPFIHFPNLEQYINLQVARDFEENGPAFVGIYHIPLEEE